MCDVPRSRAGPWPSFWADHVRKARIGRDPTRRDPIVTRAAGPRSLVFFLIAEGSASFRGKRKIGELSPFGMGNLAGVGKRKKPGERGEAAGVCPGLVSWTSFCSSPAPVDRLAPRNVRCTMQLVIVLAGARSAARERSEPRLFDQREED